MKRTQEISANALKDLDDIWFYIAADSSDAANKWITKVRKRIADLVVFPEAGRARPEVGSDVRSVPVGNYVVLFRVRPDSITVARVIHGARDLETEV